MEAFESNDLNTIRFIICEWSFFDFRIWFNHHSHVFKRRVHMDAVPLYSVSHEIVTVNTSLVIYAIQVRFKTTFKPPCTVVVFSTIVVNTIVIISVLRAERLVVVVFPVWCKRVTRISMVTMNVKPEVVVFSWNPEVVIFREVFMAFPIHHFYP